MTPRSRRSPGNRSVIVVAGEGDHDRQVLRHLIPALHPRPCPKIAVLKRPIRLAKAQVQLNPRLDNIRTLAQGIARKEGAELAGIVVHVDLDHVTDESYERARARIRAEMRKVFFCPSALALAAWETEAWLMLFPDSFPKVKPSWRLSEADRRRDLGKLRNAKEHLRRTLTQPPYRESDAPDIMRAAVEHKLVNPKPSGRNLSYEDFVADIGDWPVT